MGMVRLELAIICLLLFGVVLALERIGKIAERIATMAESLPKLILSIEARRSNVQPDDLPGHGLLIAAMQFLDDEYGAGAAWCVAAA
jgi:hypothetical protein